MCGNKHGKSPSPQVTFISDISTLASENIKQTNSASKKSKKSEFPISVDAFKESEINFDSIASDDIINKLISNSGDLFKRVHSKRNKSQSQSLNSKCVNVMNSQNNDSLVDNSIPDFQISTTPSKYRVKDTSNSLESEDRDNDDPLHKKYKDSYIRTTLGEIRSTAEKRMKSLLLSDEILNKCEDLNIQINRQRDLTQQRKFWLNSANADSLALGFDSLGNFEVSNEESQVSETFTAKWKLDSVLSNLIETNEVSTDQG